MKSVLSHESGVSPQNGGLAGLVDRAWRRMTAARVKSKQNKSVAPRWAFGLVVFGCVALAFSGTGMAETAPARLERTNEVFCGMVAPARGGKPNLQPEGTRKMVERLEKIRRESLSLQQNNTFLSAEIAEDLRKKLAAMPNGPEALDTKLQLGIQLLRAGKSEEALQHLEQVEKMASQNGVRLDSRTQGQLRLLRAMCYLRMGEQENCLTNHTSESCLMPIGPKGVHQLPRGSRGAVEVLSHHLSRAPHDLNARWLLNLAYMTLGEYPARVPEQWLISPKVFESDYDIKRFPDVAGAAGLDVDGLAGGSVMEDFDGDGFLDLMISDWSIQGQLRFFHNHGDGTFAEHTAEAGLTGLLGGLNMIQTDYNNDGKPDVLILRGAWLASAGHHPNSLLRNNGNGTFEDVTEQAGLLSFHPTQTAAWFDYNGDGWLDLFIGNETTPGETHPCELYRNNGDGTFTECAGESGVALTQFIKGVAAGDFNNDGRPDLYLSSRSGPNTLLRNDGSSETGGSPKGKWKFTDVTEKAGVREPMSSFPTWFFDYDNDGWQDIFVSGYASRDTGEIAADYLRQASRGERARLYHNNHDGTFSDVAPSAGVSKVLLSMGSNFGDLDNDGWLDFYLGTGDPELGTLIPNRMFRNNGGKAFQDVTTSGGFGHLQKGHAVSFGDLDNDGDQDVFIKMGGAYSGDNYRSALFLNPGHGNHWITLKLEGVRSNRAALGARIRVIVDTREGERSIYKTVSTGGSFGASPLRQEIGLGQAIGIRKVEIFWPTTGQTQIIAGVSMDRFYKIREGEAEAVAWDVRSFRMPLIAPHHGEGHGLHTTAVQP